MKSNNDAASVKCCARKIWAHFKEFIVSAKGDLKETHDEMFQGADTPKSACSAPSSTVCCCWPSYA